MTNVPSTGRTDITFPLTIVEADHISGYYFAQQFQFINSGIRYTGQPRPSSTASSRTLSLGAPRPMRTAALALTAARASLARVVWDVWSHIQLRGCVQRRDMDRYRHRYASSQVRFVEWNPWNSGEPPNHCAKLPYQTTIFSAPFTSHSGSQGMEGLAYEYGDCVGQVASYTYRSRRKRDLDLRRGRSKALDAKEHKFQVPQIQFEPAVLALEEDSEARRRPASRHVALVVRPPPATSHWSLRRSRRTAPRQPLLHTSPPLLMRPVLPT
ncbi:hypothetical protein GGX14DRAFT_558281 [Mycena pura]|uniref:Uncharacterized protein n=1 Tax=Mycena pura TaxID=153505 RepID=A0AAD6VXI4_9AGAR|nr:hypothetical protein GGX14DRAFT_558281 [Mycena pura]